MVIEKTSDEYKNENNPPPCPSVMLNDKVIVKDGTVTYDQLREEIFEMN